MIDWQGAKLHLCCGGHHLEGWVNADGAPGPAVDVTLDVHQDMASIPDGVLTWVYCSHAVEHWYPNLVPGIFKHLYRALQPGGKLTIATTDLLGIFTNCFLSRRYADKWEGPLFGQTASTDHPFAAHRDCFTPGKLADMLRAAGFKVVRNWAPTDYPEIHALNDFATSAALVSCHVEGIK